MISFLRLFDTSLPFVALVAALGLLVGIAVPCLAYRVLSLVLHPIRSVRAHPTLFRVALFLSLVLALTGTDLALKNRAVVRASSSLTVTDSGELRLDGRPFPVPRDLPAICTVLSPKMVTYHVRAARTARLATFLCLALALVELVLSRRASPFAIVPAALLVSGGLGNALSLVFWPGVPDIYPLVLFTSGVLTPACTFLCVNPADLMIFLSLVLWCPLLGIFNRTKRRENDADSSDKSPTEPDSDGCSNTKKGGTPRAVSDFLSNQSVAANHDGPELHVPMECFTDPNFDYDSPAYVANFKSVLDDTIKTAIKTNRPILLYNFFLRNSRALIPPSLRGDSSSTNARFWATTICKAFPHFGPSLCRDLGLQA